LIAPLWVAAKEQAPAGQTVLLVGTTDQASEAGGWTRLTMRVDPPVRQPPRLISAPIGGPVPEPKSAVQTAPPEPSLVILVGGKDPSCPLPQGRVAVGGLLVGRWTAPGAPAAPVVFAVVAVGAK
jgi:hypothetical protein